MSPVPPTFSGRHAFGKSMFHTLKVDIFSSGITSSFPHIDIPDDKKITEKFGLPLLEKQTCPECGVEGDMREIIAHLNNRQGETLNSFDYKHGTHDWTFKQIGLWLKELGY